MAEDINHDEMQAAALSYLAEVSIADGDIRRADTLVDAITSSFLKARTLAHLAIASAATGDVERTNALVAAISPPDERAELLTYLAHNAAKAGDVERAIQLAENAENAARHVVDLDRQDQAVTALARAFASARDYDRAERIASTICNPRERAYTFRDVADAAATTGDTDRAATLAQLARVAAESIDDAHVRQMTLTHITLKGADTDAEPSPMVAKRTRELAGDASDLMHQIQDLADNATVVATVRARSLIARALADSEWIDVVDVLAEVDAVALNVLTDEYLQTAAFARDLWTSRRITSSAADDSRPSVDNRSLRSGCYGEVTAPTLSHTEKHIASPRRAMDERNAITGSDAIPVDGFGAVKIVRRLAR